MCAEGSGQERKVGVCHMDKVLRVSRWREQHLQLNAGIPEMRRQWSVSFICSVSVSFGGEIDSLINFSPVRELHSSGQ